MRRPMTPMPPMLLVSVRLLERVDRDTPFPGVVPWCFPTAAAGQ